MAGYRRLVLADDIRNGSFSRSHTVKKIGHVIDNGIKLAGWYYSEIGELNQVVHIWAFRDYQHMEEGKQQFRQDPQWMNEYLPRTRGLVVKQETKIVLSPDFAPQPA